MELDSNYKDLFLKYFDSQSMLSNEEILLLLANSKVLKFKKNELITEINNSSNYVMLIVDGVIRTFKSINGKEVTNSFFQSNRFFGDLDKILYDKPSYYNVQSLRNTTVFAIPVENFQKLIKTSLAVNHLTLNAYSYFMKYKSEKENLLIAFTAYERLKHLKENMKEVYDSIPHVIIATYVGCTPVQLSRLSTRLKEEESQIE